MPERRTRTYDASGRQASARQSRARILDAARRRFLEQGYASTTIAAIAADAGVSAQSVTKHFGNKPGLVHALFETALVGDDEPTPLAQRAWILAIHEEPDPREKLRQYARVLSEMLPRTAPVQLLMREASADPSVAAVWDRIRAGRLLGMTDLAENLAAGEHLRPGVSVDDARDVLWVYSSPEVYELFVMERGHAPAEYANLIAAATIAALLPLPPS
jgi:AcrR family transcriptional regulator